MHECNMVVLRELLCPSDKWAGGRAAEKRDELPPFHLHPVGAEETLRGYQLPALTASLCCIAKGAWATTALGSLRTRTGRPELVISVAAYPQRAAVACCMCEHARHVPETAMASLLELYAFDVLPDGREQMFVVSFANEHACPRRA